jgi:hypothetical protein
MVPSVSARELRAELESAAPLVIDVRREDAYGASAEMRAPGERAPG